MSDSESSTTEIICEDQNSLEQVTQDTGKFHAKILRSKSFSPYSTRSKSSETKKSQSEDNTVSFLANLTKIPQLTMSTNQNTNSTNVGTQNVVQVPQKNELQMLLNALPEFSPGQNLSIFIKEVDNLLNHLINRLTPDLQYIVDFSIRSKIHGEARDYIAYQDASNWTSIRAALLQKYGDQRSEDILINTLRNCVQVKSESYFDYYSRLLQSFNALVQNLSLNCTDPNLLNYKKLEFGKLALNTFQNGILEPYRSYLSHFSISTIEDCLNKCRLLDNKNQEWEYCEYLRRNGDGISKKNFSFTTPNPMQFAPPPPKATLFNPFSPRQQTPNFGQQLVKPNFFQQRPIQPFRPFNQPMIRPNQMPPKQPSYPQHQFQGPQRPGFARMNPLARPNFPVNRPVYASRPNNGQNHQQFKPEPMSVQSRVRTNQIPQQRQQNFPQGLFNVETAPAETVQETYGYEDDQEQYYPYYEEGNYSEQYGYQDQEESTMNIEEIEEQTGNFQEQASIEYPT